MAETRKRPGAGDERTGAPTRRKSSLHLLDPGCPQLSLRPYSREVSDALADVTYSSDHQHVHILSRIKRQDALPFVLTSYLKRMVDDPALPTVNVPSIAGPGPCQVWAQATFCKAAVLFTADSMFQEPVLTDGPIKTRFAEFCERGHCRELLALVAALSRNWNLLEELVNVAPEFPDHDFALKLFWFCMEHGACAELLTSLLSRQFHQSPLRWLHFDPRLFSKEQLKRLAVLSQGMPTLHVFFLAQLEDWTSVLTITEDLQNQRVNNLKATTIFLLVVSGLFSDAKTMYSECTSVATLNEARRLVYECGSSEWTSLAVRTVNYVHEELYLYYLYRKGSIDELNSIIESAVYRPPEQGLEHAYLCIRNGLSLRYQDGLRLCRLCINKRRPKLLRMLLDADAIHSQQYFNVISEDNVPLEFQQEIDEADPYHGAHTGIPCWRRELVQSLNYKAFVEMLRSLHASNGAALSAERDYRLDVNPLPSRVCREYLKFMHLRCYLQAAPLD